ncbi:kinase-like domain-containing protein [Aspergillus avenaceus]|uniref:Kinase-like domain-containing protein n=1 Tax=Aspergillus avenaceus TaxID=36643 RepID=A0A5N6U495_ASPAV|nr:kinase-like domain-containing protein [Aspergillus avenaceus]
MAESPSDEGCVACGWTLDRQNRCSYCSHIKVIYTAHNRGVWSIGSDFILKERPNDGPREEVTTLNYLAANTKIPIPKVIRDWVDRNDRYFLLEERIDGQTLGAAWPSLSDEQKVSIAEEVADVHKYLLQRMTSTSMQTVDQGPCRLEMLFFDQEPREPFHSDLELWDAISRTLHSPPEKVFPQRALDNLKKRFPKCEPYVLSHCDLDLENIMVKDGKLVAILDWEYSAYLPVWYEYISALWGFSDMGVEWNRMLRPRLGVHEDAKDFAMDLFYSREYPNLDEKGREVLERLSSE